LARFEHRVTQERTQIGLAEARDQGRLGLMPTDFIRAARKISRTTLYPYSVRKQAMTPKHIDI